jgi:hypothetical protein
MAKGRAPVWQRVSPPCLKWLTGLVPVGRARLWTAAVAPPLRALAFFRGFPVARTTMAFCSLIRKSCGALGAPACGQLNRLHQRSLFQVQEATTHARSAS